MYHVQTTGYTRGQRQPKGLNIGFGYAHTTAQGNGIGGTIVGRNKHFTLAAQIRNWIEYQIEYYPENKRILATMKADLIPSQISQYGPKEGSSFDSEKRPTEDVAIRIINDRYIHQLELTVSAIGSVYESLSSEDKELIRLKYWSGELTPEGIALKMNIGIATFYRRLNAILMEVGQRLGYIDF